MPQGDASLWRRIARSDGLSTGFLRAADRSIALAELNAGSSLECGREALDDRCVLIATTEQLTAALALIELDGVARRLILCPPDLPVEHIAHVIADAGVEAVVTDEISRSPTMSHRTSLVRCSPRLKPAAPLCPADRPTEWILLTSGTTGLPKLVVHTLASLTGAIAEHRPSPPTPRVWSTFYDIRRYGGLQIFLRAALGGGSLVLSNRAESIADFLLRAGRDGVTHISGTPSHWRRALISGYADRIAPKYVRLSGEIAEQRILDDLRAFYPAAGIAHAFASTEAGVAFEVEDGLAGFPAAFVDEPGGAVELKVEDGSLRIRSTRTASHYLGRAAAPIRDRNGLVDTGDMLEGRGNRYYFVGRRDGTINVGGLKVHPEEVEAVINCHPAVQMALCKARRNAFTGAVVVADVVLRSDAAAEPDRQPAELQDEILTACRRNLPHHKVPAVVRFVASLDQTGAGKLARLGA